MSLINDALRRAKAAQEQNAPAASPELRFRQPVAPLPNRRSPAWLLVGIACGLVVFMGLMAFTLRKWSAAIPVAASPAPARTQHESLSQTESTKETARDPSAESKAAAQVPPQSEIAATTAPEPIAANTSSQGVTGNAGSPATASQPEPDHQGNTPPSGRDHPEHAAAAATETAVVAPPKPPEPKLQGIFYNPARPSAMINGRTLFVGDKLGELKVTAIDQASATLVGPGRTNVLSLDQ